MILKLCGFTIAEQAATAARLGATHVGIVLWPRSKRAASIEQTSAVAAAAREHGAEPVAVVVDHAGDELLALPALGVERIQLHGEHTLEDAALLQQAGVPFWRALRVGSSGVDRALAASWRAAGADAIVLDAYVPGAPGGTGARVDLSTAAAFAADGPTVLAGGLTPANVASAIAAARPSGVDVASGIERAPGDKDEDAMRRFVEQARAALEEIG